MNNLFGCVVRNGALPKQVYEVPCSGSFGWFTLSQNEYTHSQLINLLKNGTLGDNALIYWVTDESTVPVYIFKADGKTEYKIAYLNQETGVLQWYEPQLEDEPVDFLVYVVQVQEGE